MIQVVVVRDPFDLGAREITEAAPGFIADLIPDDLRDQEGLSVMLDGTPIERDDWASTYCSEGVLGILLRPGDLITIAKFILYVVAAYAVGRIIARQFAPNLRPPEKLGDNSSPIYNFDGISNTRTEGIPLPLIFGKIRYGGNVVNEYLRSFGIPEESWLYQQISYGEGPVYSIDGKTSDTPTALNDTGYDLPDPTTRINDNSAENYSFVSTAVRLGSNEQEYIPGFEAVRTSYYAAFSLNSPETTSTDTSTNAAGYDPAAWNTSANDAYFDQWGASIDITEADADSAIARLFFPRGLYTQNTSTGAIDPAWLSWAVRYRELDSLGNPITTGGHLGDGWVRLKPYPNMPREATDSFYMEAPITFYDPQSYTPKLAGYCLDGYATVPPPTGYEKYGTISFWCRLSDNQAITTIYNAGKASSTVPGSSSGTSSWDWRILCQNGNLRLVYDRKYVNANGTSGEQEQNEIIGPVPENAWFMVTIAKWAGFQPTTKIWINESLVYQKTIPTNYFVYRGLRWSAAYQSGVIGSSVSQIDGFWYAHAITVDTATVVAAYNGGFGLTDSPVGTYTSFDINGDNADWGNWTAGGSSTIGVVDGWIDDPAGDDPVNKRSRYRVQIARTNQTSTASNVANQVEFSELQAVTENELTYPNSPILSMKIRATDQLNSSAPTTTTIVEGLLVPVWDGQSTFAPNVVSQYSANPAWICLGILTDKRWGLGATYQIKDCISDQLYEWAQYCDDIVYTGSIQRQYQTPVPGYEDVVFSNNWVDQSTGETRGSIVFKILVEDFADSVPPEWEPGAYLRCHGFPVIGGGTDINQGALGSTTPGGYEIFSYAYTPASPGIPAHWQFNCYWDRLDEPDPWTTGFYLSAVAPGGASDLTGATIELGERRHQFNGVFDREQGAWDAILEVATVGRAIPIREGSRVRFKWQHPRFPIGVITGSSIVKDSFRISYSDASQLPNALDVTIADRQQDYQLAPVTVLDPTITNVTSLDEVRKESRNYIGITSRGQAQRQAIFELNMNRLLKRTGKFTLGAEGIPYEPGDLVRLSHDLLPRGTGGRAITHSSANIASHVEMLSGNNDMTHGSWTASGGLVVTANTSSNPFGTATESDRLDDPTTGHQYIQQTGSTSPLKTEWLSWGIWVKPGTASKSLFALILPAGSASFLVDWATATAEPYATASMPEKRRGIHVQKFGASGWYRVQVSAYHLKSDGDAAPIVRLFPASDVAGSSGAATGTIEVWGSHLSYGRWAAAGFGTAAVRCIPIDRKLTIDAGTHTAYTSDFRDKLGSANVDISLCPAGNYDIGDLIVTSSGMGTSVQENNNWIVCKSGDELVVEIVGSQINQDLSRECDWVEYNEDIFNDVPTAESDSPLLRFQGGENDSPPLLGNGYNEDSLPEPTYIVSVKDIWVRRGPGQYVPTLYIQMQHDPATKHYLSRTELHWRTYTNTTLEAGGRWNWLGSTSTGEDYVALTLPQGTTAGRIEIAACPINRKGLRRPVGVGGTYSLELRGLTAPPEKPVNVEATLAENQAVYGYQVEGDDLLSIECRRGGGWILGQPVFREEAGQRAGARRVGPTLNWAGSSYATPTLRFAAMNSTGAYGPWRALSFNPTVDADSFPFDGTSPDQQWEAYDANGWEPAVPAPGDAFIGPQFEENADGELVYTAVSTSTVWTTAYTTQQDNGAILTLEQSKQPRRFFVEAFVDAYAEHQQTWEDSEWEWGDMLYDRWTWEGPRYTVPGEVSNPELQIQFRVNRDGTSAGWGDWRDYTPGIYTFVDIQFRLRARRHDVGQNMRIAQFHTRVTPPRMSLEDKTPMQSFLLHEMFQ